ncbi:VirD4-like conjugal transfer protein, CD1115 family [Acetobacterium sp.]|uniref:VirD4-like conjugal transfer protein, CD1115 family n=1 Tax=Acetobacterium sp. TaxID=1872094 RepID=UPI002F42C809
MEEKKKQLIVAILIFFGGSFSCLYFARVIDGLLTGQGVLNLWVPFGLVFGGVLDSEPQRMIFFLLIGIVFLLAVSFFVSSNKSYRSDVNQITPAIKTPVATGQYQCGSAVWLSEKEKKEAFESFILKKNSDFMKGVMQSGNEEKMKIRERVCWTDPVQHCDKEPLKHGGLVVGKSDLKHGNEEIYFIGEDVHGLIIGSTRCGKTRTVVLQTIATLVLASESMVVCDPKGELHNYTSAFAKKCGFDVYALDFKNPLKSDCYNFLQPVIDAINEGDESRAIDITWDITRAMVGEAKGEKIWNQGEASIIASAILVVVIENQDQPDLQNMTNVYFFISKMCKPPKHPDPDMAIVKYMNDLKGINPTHPAVGLLAISEIAPSRTRGSFYTAALATLRLFTNPLIYEMTRKSDFRPRQLGEKKTIIYMILPDEKTTYYSLASLFCTQQYGALINLADGLGGRLPIRTNFVLDEFGNFTSIPDFANQLTVGGGRGIRFNLFLQSFAQLEEKYGKEVARIIKGNCETWIYLQTDDPETLREISDKLGKYTTSVYSLSSSQQRFAEGSSSQSVNLVGRELLMPDEVKKIRRPYNLVTSRNNPAIMISPDVSGWVFNDLFGMGSENHNTKLRIIRDEARPKKREEKIKLWRIWEEYSF